MGDVNSVNGRKVLLESGDILFYKTSGSIFDRLIAWWTKSPYVHVAIALDSKNQIEARANGVLRTGIDMSRVGAVWHMDRDIQDANVGGNTVAEALQKRLTIALVWLNMQVGREYSWADIVDAVAEKWYQKFYIVQTQHYDCSALAAEFMKRAGFGLLIRGVATEQVTPGMLANKLKYMKSWQEI